MTIPLEIAPISCAVLGFHHGLDYDHLAAISDITSVREKASTAMRLGLLYPRSLSAPESNLGGNES
jgi:high-affinity nickel-transport protein